MAFSTRLNSGVIAGTELALPGFMAHDAVVNSLSRKLAKSLNASRKRRFRQPPIKVSSEISARNAGLQYATDLTTPGICRVRNGDVFYYTHADGNAVTEPDTIRRIKSLVIPPAWTHVWISPYFNGHLQATGRDARGRKQYRYHSQWRTVRDETKYGRMIAFSKALPAVREQVARDLSLPGLPRRKVLATIIRLLETTFIRVGNEEYARTNNSFGLTTMRDDHVKMRRTGMRFQFRGKSGKEHRIDVDDKFLARIVKKCRDIPGYELFQYIDEHGSRKTVASCDVNSYLKEISGEDFTAKDFRTWAGTILAAKALSESQEFRSQRDAKKNIVRAVENVSQKLGNTPSVCRKCYIHPAIIEAYMDGELAGALRNRIKQETSPPHALAAEEANVTALLRRRMQEEVRLTEEKHDIAA